MSAWIATTFVVAAVFIAFAVTAVFVAEPVLAAGMTIGTIVAFGAVLVLINNPREGE